MAGPLETEATEARNHFRVAIPDIMKRRDPIENEWLLNHHCWRGIRTRFFYSDGISEHYVPAARRSIEKFVKRCRRQLIPSQDFFEVYPWDEAAPGADKEAEGVKAYVLYVLTRHMRMRAWLDQIIRSILLYGRAIVKNSPKFVDIPVQLPVNGRQRIIMLSQVWPTSRVVDPFNWYFWPESANTLDEMQVIFENVMMPFEEYRQLSERPNSPIEQIEPRELGKPQWPIRHQLRLQTSGLSEPSLTASGGTEKGEMGSEFVQLSEVWFRKKGVWKRQWLVWNVSDGPRQVWYQRAPFPEPPYRFSLDRQLPGEGYSTSVMSDLEPLNVWLNDEINMTEDARLTAMAPPVLINPTAIFREESLVHRPRAKWMVDPEGVEFPVLPNVSKIGMEGVTGILGLLDSFGSANPLADGQTMRGMPRAGFAVTTLVNLALTDITAVAEVLEDDILTPTLSDIHKLGIMFTPQDQMLRIPAVMGLKGRQMKVEDLYNDYAFRWVGSVQSQDFQVKAQRMMTFLGLLAKTVPALQQSGKKVNWDLLLRRMWREGIGERGAGTIIEDMGEEEAQFAMLMQQGMGGGGARGQVAIPGQSANPATTEQANAGMSRNLAESQIGQSMAGTGTGA